MTTFGYTALGNLDLSLPQGLETAHHIYPSTVGTDTLKKSQGRIPEVFLRGCGLSDWEIKNTRLWDPDLSDGEYTRILYEVANARLTGNAINFYSCFISYSHDDKAFAKRLHDNLQSHGVRCWLDEHQLLPGDDIYDTVDRGIRLWDKVLLCCSNASLSSWWVNDEIDKALEKERKLLMQRGEKVLAIIPLNLDDHLFEWRNGRGTALRKRLAADFTFWETDDAKFEDQFEKVMRALRADDMVREEPPGSKL